jgi:hypothetical protein
LSVGRRPKMCVRDSDLLRYKPAALAACPLMHFVSVRLFAGAESQLFVARARESHSLLGNEAQGCSMP